MCGRYTLTARRLRLLEERLNTTFPELSPRYNIAPSQPVPIVRAAEEGYELATVRWGLVPSWSKDPKSSYSMINARAETVAEKPAYRTPFRRRRCLSRGRIYEWRRTNGRKEPYHIRAKNRSCLPLRGSGSTGRGGQVVESCSIIVTEANDLVRSIHDRCLDPALRTIGYGSTQPSPRRSN
jgi:putative SOS response-associated peptidase YedK